MILLDGSYDEDMGSVGKDNVRKRGIKFLVHEMVDFDIFSKSDFGVVKVKACEPVPESKKLLKFTLNDGIEWKDSNRNHKSAAQEDDGS